MNRCKSSALQMPLRLTKTRSREGRDGLAAIILRNILLGGLFAVSLLSQTTNPQAQQPGPGASEADLAKAVQNPVASLVSVPIQNLTDFNIGPYSRARNTALQFQPVIPIQISPNWNLITRVIGAFTYQPDVNPTHSIQSQQQLGTFGFGDLNPSFFFSPAKPGKLIWGAGPSFLLPTASDDVLGTGKFSIGPTAVALLQPGRWTLGALVSNLFSVAGPSGRPDVNSFTLQYFVNYNLNKGFFLTWQPIVTANWNARRGDKWTVPIGGGIARIFKVGAQPMNASVQAYWNVERPDSIPSPTWQLKFQVALLFPKAPKR
jgi:hypothetical protein